jgi:hypothetical protein
MTDIKQIFLVLILWINSATSQVGEVEKIDSMMTSDRKKCIDAQANLVSLHSNLSKNVTSLVSTLRSNSLSLNLVTALENLNNLLKMQMSVKDFEPYVNITTCGDINYKITMIEFDQQKLLRVVNRARINSTDLYTCYAQVAAYSGQIVTTQFYTSVTSVMTQTVTILSEFNKLVVVLYQSYTNCAINSNMLNIFKRTYCSCLKTVSMTGYNSTLEANVNVIESKLVTLQTSIKNHTSTSLSNVRAAYTAITSEFIKFN